MRKGFWTGASLALCGLALAAGSRPAVAQIGVVCLLPVNGWGTTIFGTTEHDGADAVHADLSECAVYVGGSTAALMDGLIYGGGLSDAFVRRYSTFGSVTWTRQLGSSGVEGITGVATDSLHNVYVVGSTTGQLPGAPEANAGLSDAFIAKYDRNGNLQWVHQLGSTGDDEAHGVAISAQNEVFVTGEARGILPGGTIYTGGADAFLAKYDASGNLLFTELYGTPADDGGRGVAIGPGGKIFMTGYTEDDMPYYTDPFFNPDFWHGGQDIFVGKYSPVDGSLIWIRQRGTGFDDSANGVAVNADNQVFLAGSTEGALDGNLTHGYEDIVVLRYDTDGTWVWTDQRGTIFNERARSVTVDASGRPFVGGYTFGAMDGQAHIGSSDNVLLRYGKAGAWQWTRQFGSSDADNVTDLAFSVGGYLVAVGFTAGNFGGAFGLGLNDAFTVYYDQAGNPR